MKFNINYNDLLEYRQKIGIYEIEALSLLKSDRSKIQIKYNVLSDEIISSRDFELQQNDYMYLCLKHGMFKPGDIIITKTSPLYITLMGKNKFNWNLLMKSTNMTYTCHSEFDLDVFAE